MRWTLILLPLLLFGCVSPTEVAHKVGLTEEDAANALLIAEAYEKDPASICLKYLVKRIKRREALYKQLPPVKDRGPLTKAMVAYVVEDELEKLFTDPSNEAAINCGPLRVQVGAKINRFKRALRAVGIPIP